MWKALIADDEAFSRYALRTFLSKKVESIEVVAEAADGDEAVALAMEHQPELLFLDIKMPGKNGIVAAESILKLQRGIKIVILTAYDHFSYIQQALDLGVKGYLLKPFRQDALEEKIGDLLEDLEVEEKALVPHKNRELERVRLYGESRLLELLLFAGGSQGEAEQLARYLDVPVPEKGVLLLLKGGPASERQRVWLARELSPGNSFLSGKGFGASGIILLSAFGDGAEDDVDVGSLKNRFLRFREDQNRFTKLAALISPVPEKSRLPEIFRNALSLLDNLEEGEVLVSDSCSGDVEGSWFDFPHEQEEAFLSALANGNLEKADVLLHALYPLLDRCGRDEIEVVDHIGELVILARRKGRIAGYANRELSSRFSLRRTASLRDRDEALALLKELMGWFKEDEFREATSTPVLKISRAYLYTREHIFKDISLEMVAEAVGLSPQYLSKRFKEEYGTSFTDYVTTERINRASFLLGTADLSVKEVCSRVGYSDANYFSRVFKKNTGFTPQQYRSSLAGEELSTEQLTEEEAEQE